jgi:DNA-binding XRE family transcriptional regulator
MRIWLRELRNKKNLSQATLAKEIGISQNYYSDIENGHKQTDMNLSIAAKIADFFNIPLSEIRLHEEGLIEPPDAKGV